MLLLHLALAAVFHHPRTPPWRRRTALGCLSLSLSLCLSLSLSLFVCLSVCLFVCPSESACSKCLSNPVSHPQQVSHPLVMRDTTLAVRRDRARASKRGMPRNHKFPHVLHVLYLDPPVGVPCLEAERPVVWSSPARTPRQEGPGI